MGYSIAGELFGSWAAGLVIIAIRLYARRVTGARNFYWDDFCLGSAVVWWTMHTVFLYLLTSIGSNIGLNEKTAMEVPDGQVHTLRQGSIYAFVAWISYICMVWSFKGVLLFLYYRITTGLWQHRLTLIMSGFCVCTFVTSFIFNLSICHPIEKNWQVKPYAGDNCTIRPLHYIIIEVLNIVTDIGVMCVPLPLIIEAKIPTFQKIILGLLFSSGIFVMIAAVLRAYYSVSNISNLETALGWASREALVSVIVVCAPGIKPLLGRFKWFQSFKSSSNGYGYSGNQRNTTTGKSGVLHSKSGNFTAVGTQNDDNNEHPYEMGILKKNKGGKRDDDSSTESKEHIIENGKNGNRNSPPRDNDGIMVTTEYTLAHDDRKSAHEYWA